MKAIILLSILLLAAGPVLADKPSWTDKDKPTKEQKEALKKEMKEKQEKAKKEQEKIKQEKSEDIDDELSEKEKIKQEKSDDMDDELSAEEKALKEKCKAVKMQNRGNGKKRAMEETVITEADLDAELSEQCAKLNNGLAKQAEMKADATREELEKGSETGQQKKAENSKKWWKFWE